MLSDKGGLRARACGADAIYRLGADIAGNDHRALA
jgi:hypothetical protein